VRRIRGSRFNVRQAIQPVLRNQKRENPSRLLLILCALVFFFACGGALPPINPPQATPTPTPAPTPEPPPGRVCGPEDCDCYHMPPPSTEWEWIDCPTAPTPTPEPVPTPPPAPTPTPCGYPDEPVSPLTPMKTTADLGCHNLSEFLAYQLGPHGNWKRYKGVAVRKNYEGPKGKNAKGVALDGSGRAWVETSRGWALRRSNPETYWGICPLDCPAPTPEPTPPPVDPPQEGECGPVREIGLGVRCARDKDGGNCGVDPHRPVIPAGKRWIMFADSNPRGYGYEGEPRPLYDLLGDRPGCFEGAQPYWEQDCEDDLCVDVGLWNPCTPGDATWCRSEDETAYGARFEYDFKATIRLRACLNGICSEWRSVRHQ